MRPTPKMWRKVSISLYSMLRSLSVLSLLFLFLLLLSPSFFMWYCRMLSCLVIFVLFLHGLIVPRRMLTSSWQRTVLFSVPGQTGQISSEQCHTTGVAVLGNRSIGVVSSKSEVLRVFREAIEHSPSQKAGRHRKNYWLVGDMNRSLFLR